MCIAMFGINNPFKRDSLYFKTEIFNPESA